MEWVEFNNRIRDQLTYICETPSEYKLLMESELSVYYMAIRKYYQHLNKK